MKIPELELDLQKSSLSLELSLNSIKNIREHELGKIAELEKKKLTNSSADLQTLLNSNLNSIKLSVRIPDAKRPPF